MKQALTLGLVIIALTAFNPFLYSQNKTGYVSIDEVVQLMPDYKKATGEMSQYDSTLQIEYAETLKELNRQDSLFKMDSTKMSPAAKNAKKEMMKKLLVELQGYEQNYQQKMQQKQEELMAPIAQKANQLIADVAKASGYTYVFRKEALLVQPDADDLLPLIKKKLEGGTPKPPVK
ncbi:MAG: OmpH family outer membrane protein [Chitinophagaceae bacterium]|jgi:outer membrane protein